ncbi:F-box domain containing protein [Trema orientale]|uniref:F-box domain containing protein n=1 Tax=Trema orientale TaxID=63057 RepID=A0A2P5DFV0_TREOI|nr:F-box domain containing protein [Trema orientale]
MESLPCNIIEEIVSRLDVKSLMRLKCASKSWLSLICRSDFIVLHLKRQKSSRLLYPLYIHPIDDIARHGNSLSVRSSENFEEIYSHVLNMVDVKSPYLTLVGNDNGILCFQEVTNCDMVYLLNPATKESKRIPPPPACPPRTNYTLYGFGYDSLTNDFKVVKVSKRPGIHGSSQLRDNKSSDQVRVYSLRRNSWKTLMTTSGIFSELELGSGSSSSDTFTYVNQKYSVVVNGSTPYVVVIMINTYLI